MAGTYCGTSDLRMVYSAYTDLMGTDYGDFITAASEWLEAEFYAHNMTPPPVSPLTGGYDYWLRRATAERAVFVACDAMLTERTESPDGAWWMRYSDGAQTILDDIRTGRKRLSYQTAQWQVSISPAVPWENGTVAPPPPDVLHTNGAIGGHYESDIPRQLEFEMDGIGTTISDCTYRYRSVAGSAYYGEGQPCDPDNWIAIGWNLMVLWTPPQTGTLEAGHRWRVYLTPRGAQALTGGAVSKMRRWG